MAALHAFMYYTPSRLVLVLLAGQFFYADNEGGFNRMFEEMIKDQDIDITYNFEARVKKSRNIP